MVRKSGTKLLFNSLFYYYFVSENRRSEHLKKKIKKTITHIYYTHNLFILSDDINIGINIVH